jgi:hypothetical protein
MATLAQSVRVTIRNSAAWRTCETCDTLTALPSDVEHCGGSRRKSRRAAR